MHPPLKEITALAEKHITVTLRPSLMREEDFSQHPGHTQPLTLPLVSTLTYHEAIDDVILCHQMLNRPEGSGGGDF